MEDFAVARELDAIAAGHLCLDIIPGFAQTEAMKQEDVFTPGKLVNVTEAAISTGGPVSNTGIALTRLGIKVAFMARVGDDIFGKITMDLLAKNADTSGVHPVEGQASSYTVAIAPPGIDRIFFHSPGTNNTFQSTDVDYDLVARAKLFHLGYPPLMRRMYENDGAEMIKIFKKVKETGTLTSLDMSLPDPNSPSGQVDWHKILENLLPYVDIFQPSVEEGTYMARRERFLEYRERCKKELLDEFSPADFSDLSEQFLAWGARVASIKTGHRGVYIRTSDVETLAPVAELLPIDLSNWAGREIWAPAYKIERILSATGSGDSSIAGLLAAAIRGLPIEQTAKMSSSLGFQNLHALDAISGIRGWQESVAITQDNSVDVISPNVEGPGWSFDESTDIYRGPADQPAASS